MSEDEREELSDELAELVRAERSRPKLTGGRARALRDGVDHALDQLQERVPVASAPRPNGAPRAVWFASGAIAGVLVSWAILRAFTPSVVVTQTVVIHDASARWRDEGRAQDSATRDTAVLVAPSDASSDDLRAQALRVSPSARSARVRPQGAETDDALERERALVEAARSAVARGAFAAALDAIREHERGFRGGRLAEERDALRVVALARGGQREEAWARAQVFLRRYPQSLSRALVESVVAPEPR